MSLQIKCRDYLQLCNHKMQSRSQHLLVHYIEGTGVSYQKGEKNYLIFSCNIFLRIFAKMLWLFSRSDVHYNIIRMHAITLRLFPHYRYIAWGNVLLHRAGHFPAALYLRTTQLRGVKVRADECPGGEMTVGYRGKCRTRGNDLFLGLHVCLLHGESVSATAISHKPS